MSANTSRDGRLEGRPSLTWAATIRGIIAAPLPTLTTIAAIRSWWQGLAFYVVAAVAAWLVYRVQPVASGDRTNWLADLFAHPLLDLAKRLALGPLLLTPLTALLYQVARRRGGVAYTRLLTTEYFRNATVVLVGLPLYLLMFLGLRTTGSLAPLEWLVDLVTSAWSIMLTVYSLQASMRLSTRQAIVTLLWFLLGILPFAIVFGCILGFIVAGSPR